MVKIFDSVKLADSIPYYPVLRGSITSEGVVMSVLEQRLMAMKPLSVSNIDSIKLIFMLKARKNWLHYFSPADF